MSLNTSLNRGLLIAGLAMGLTGLAGQQAAEASIRNKVRGTVSVMGKPVANASVTLWRTRGGGRAQTIEGCPLKARRKLCAIRPTQRRNRSLPDRNWWNGRQLER